MNGSNTQPEPVMNASYLAGSFITLVKLFMVAAITLGWVDLTDGEQVAIMALVAGAADFAIIVATMWYKARPKVTPLANPRDDTGAPLVRADGGDPVVKS
jgi:hypothetical protein